MKDIQSRTSSPLDLSKVNEAPLSRHKLDLSNGKKHVGAEVKSTQPRQTDFYEFMPAAEVNVNDNDFGDKLADWSEVAQRKLASGYAKATAFMVSAVAPMKRYWAVVIGAGLILGLLVIAYIATHRDWVTSFPANIFALPTAGKDRDDGKNNSQPGKSAGAAAQTPTPESAEAAKTTEAAGAGLAAPASGASSGGAAQLPVSGVVQGSGGAVNVPGSGGTSGGSTGTVTNIVKPAPAVVSEPAPTPAIITAPSLAPAPAPAPLPLTTTAPLLKTIDDAAAPVTDTLL